MECCLRPAKILTLRETWGFGGFGNETLTNVKEGGIFE